MSKGEQNAVSEYSEYICLVKRINGVVAQKTLVTELVRCKECKWGEVVRNHSIGFCENQCGVRSVITESSYCSYGERSE